MAATVDVKRLAETAVQGKVVGFIRPPPDIRVIVDKTAGFIAKHGEHMETKIMEKEAGNMKFGFLKADDPYHGYYRHKVHEFRSGGAPGAEQPQASVPPGADPSAGSGADASSAPMDSPVSAPTVPAVTVAVPAGVTAAQRLASGALTNPLSKALRSFDPEKPVIKDEFTVPVPAGATAMELDTIKLTAQYTALGGKNFLRQLSSREFRNMQFDFLRPTHPLFGYYTALVDSYNKVLNPSAALRERVAASAANGYVTLERGVHRSEGNRLDEQRRKDAAAEAEASAAALAGIDWHDFEVVETIAFPVDEDLEALEPGAGESVAVDSEPAAAGEGGEGDMDIGGDDMDTEAGAGAGAYRADEGGEQLNIRLDYVPAAASQSVNVHTHVIDPRTGVAIPLASVSEHVRIDLLDPKWKEQTARAAAKQSTTLFASGDMVAENLKRLAAARVDVFRGDEEAASASVSRSVLSVAGPAVPPQGYGGQAKRSRVGE